METFVVNELRKQAGWSDVGVTLHHVRSRAGAEIDLVLEGDDGRLVAIEVKAGVTVGPEDLRHLSWFRDRVGDRLVHGAVLYAGERPLPMGDRLSALPISQLWSVAP